MKCFGQVHIRNNINTFQNSPLCCFRSEHSFQNLFLTLYLIDSTGKVYFLIRKEIFCVSDERVIKILNQNVSFHMMSFVQRKNG